MPTEASSPHCYAVCRGILLIRLACTVLPSWLIVRSSLQITQTWASVPRAVALRQPTLVNLTERDGCENLLLIQEVANCQHKRVPSRMGVAGLALPILAPRPS